MYQISEYLYMSTHNQEGICQKPLCCLGTSISHTGIVHSGMCQKQKKYTHILHTNVSKMKCALKQSEYTELGGQMLETTVLSRNVNLSHWNCPLRHVLETKKNTHNKDRTLMKQDTLTHKQNTQSCDAKYQRLLCCFGTPVSHTGTFHFSIAINTKHTVVNTEYFTKTKEHHSQM